MASVNDSIYAMIGYVDIPSQWSAGFMIPVLKSGVLLSPKIYDYAYWGTEIRGVNRTADFEFILTGGYALSLTNGIPYIIRANSNGDTIWTNRIQIPFSGVGIGQSVEQTSDGGFIVGGYLQNLNTFQTNVMLFKTDSVGDTLWTKMYGDQIECGLNSIEETSDGGYIGLGRIVVGAPPKVYLYLMKFNAFGDTIWTKCMGTGIEGDGSYTHQLSDGGYIISGNVYNSNGLVAYLVKTDSSGNVLTGLNNIELNNQYSYSIFPNPSSGIVNVRLGDFYQQNAQIEIFDSSYRKVYSKKIGNMSNQIDLSNVVNGLYMAVLTYNGNAVLRKFVIKK
jgi:hypothetical protein